MAALFEQAHPVDVARSRVSLLDEERETPGSKGFPPLGEVSVTRGRHEGTVALGPGSTFTLGPVERETLFFLRGSATVSLSHGTRDFVDPNLTIYGRWGTVLPISTVGTGGAGCHWMTVEALEAALGIPVAHPRKLVDGRSPRAAILLTCPPRLYLAQLLLREGVALEKVRMTYSGAGAREVKPSWQRTLPSQEPEGPSAAATISLRARAHLARSFWQDQGLEDLAGGVGCSVSYLCRRFKAHMGVTVHAYKHQLRLRAALSCIAERPNADLSSLAYELGFSSHSHFTASFREFFGITPSRVRQLTSATRRGSR